MNQPNRRRFLLVSAGGWGAAALGAAAWQNSWAELPVVRRTTFALGTEVAITARHHSPAAANNAIDAAFAELRCRTAAQYLPPDSQLSVLNKGGQLTIRIRPLASCGTPSESPGRPARVRRPAAMGSVAAAAKEQCLPDVAAIAAARSHVDWRQVEVTANRIRLRQPEMKLTLNGIAQGFATDRVLAVLRAKGVEHALINAGELGSLGQSQRGDAWRVGIQHPRQPDSYIELADLDGRALATSGDYETRFSADGRHNHILDPRTGYSPMELSSVSILAPTAMEADALSTACFVLGVDSSLSLIHTTPRIDAFFVLKSGETIATPRFPLASDRSHG
jgi:thiamine biosynthesis lipoprotein